MLYKTLSAAVYGIDANIIQVEVDCSASRLTRIISTLLGCPTQRCAKAAIECALPSRIADTTFPPRTSPLTWLPPI